MRAKGARQTKETYNDIGMTSSLASSIMMMVDGHRPHVMHSDMTIHFKIHPIHLKHDKFEHLGPDASHFRLPSTLITNTIIIFIIIIIIIIIIMRNSTWVQTPAISGFPAPTA